MNMQIVESGLEKEKELYIADKFKEFYAIAEKWGHDAYSIVTANAEDSMSITMAGAMLKLIKEKRLQIESTRKILKEQSLREGQFIDSTAKQLKLLIEPIEEHLIAQAKFIEIRKKEAEEKAMAIARIKAAEEEKAAAVARAEAEAKMKAENEKLRAEAEKLKAEALKAEAEKNRAENEKIRAEALAAEEKRKAELKESEYLKNSEKTRAQMEAIKTEIEKLSNGHVKCPECGHIFGAAHV
jgi:DNA repair exonuclease SbcCD ATPase subunit